MTEMRKAKTTDQFDGLPPLDTLAIEVGYGLIPLVDVEQGGQLLDRIKSLRRQIARATWGAPPLPRPLQGSQANTKHNKQRW